MKSILTGIVVITLSVIVSHAHAADGKAVYGVACALCHTTGTMAAPKTGDKAAWAARLKIRYGHLVCKLHQWHQGHARQWRKSQFSDADVKIAVDYMISQSK